MPPRLKRYQHEGHLHFITFSCYRRLQYLADNPSRICFEVVLEGCREKHHFYVHGYVPMPEHVHLFISEPKSDAQKPRCHPPATNRKGHGFSRAMKPIAGACYRSAEGRSEAQRND